MGFGMDYLFGSMISHSTFYSNKDLFQSLTQLHFFLYTAQSDNMGGHLWASKLFIVRRVIKIMLFYISIQCQLFVRFLIPFKTVLCMLRLYVWHVNCYGMLHCLCSGLVELIVVVQSQHINIRKYSNSYAIDYTDIQPKISIDEISLLWLFCGC